MGFKLSQIGAERKSLFVPVGEEDSDSGVNIVYRPKAYTVALEDKLEEVASRTFQSVSVILMLAGFHPGDPGWQDTDEPVEGLLVSWDLTNDDETPIPIAVESLKPIPLEFLTSVLDAIQSDAKPNRETGKVSAGGSLTAAS
jgi:hypothetical protein